MIEDQGWVAIHRRLLKWEWYTDESTKSLFLHLILKANHRDGRWRGTEIKRGQLLTGRKKLSIETGLSEQKVRTAIKNLESTSELTIKPTNKYSIIELTNYNMYQVTNQLANQQSTNNQPTTNHKQQCNNDNNEKQNTLTSFAEFWKLYPKGKNRGQAEKAWSKIKNKQETLKLITVALGWQKKTDAWTKEGGQFIPYPSTYLNAKGWMDEPETKPEYKKIRY